MAADNLSGVQGRPMQMSNLLGVQGRPMQISILSSTMVDRFIILTTDETMLVARNMGRLLRARRQSECSFSSQRISGILYLYIFLLNLDLVRHASTPDYYITRIDVFSILAIEPLVQSLACRTVPNEYQQACKF